MFSLSTLKMKKSCCKKTKKTLFSTNYYRFVTYISKYSASLRASAKALAFNNVQIAAPFALRYFTPVETPLII